MKLLLSLLIGALGVTGVHSHGTEVRACVTTGGNLRFYVKHWHNDLRSARVAGTMNIQVNHLGGTVQRLSPTGHLNNLLAPQLPDCADGNPPTMVTTCKRNENDWVYYDFPTTCGNVVDYTLLAGNTVYLTEGCGGLYPARFSGTFQDKAPPQIDINGSLCTGGTAPTVTVTSCQPISVPFTVAVSDDCDPNPRYRSSHQSGDMFSPGTTQVRVSASDNTRKTSSCTFDVVVDNAACAYGDPHFKTWNGDMYDFHGVCDLVLLHNPSFGGDRGMDIHLRTKRTRQWSYVDAAAVRVGDDVLEVAGGNKENNYWINGVKGKQLAHNTELDAQLSGHAIHFKKISEKSHQFLIDLGSGENIVVATWNGFVRVNLGAGQSGTFEHSLGLMGSYDANGVKLGRDGSTVINDSDSFGQEWQVLSKEPKLFHDLEGPQAPERCEIPSSAEMRRRLADSTISREDAGIACSRVNTEDFEVCVFDVLATNDKDVAGAY